MTQPPDPTPSNSLPPGRDLLPGRTTPTWEMELLISGATVFSLLQMPGLLDRLYYTHAPRLEVDYQAAATLPYMYLMTACLALIATFLAHLCVRGYWVALVGLASVYPDGVNWNRMSSWGPAFLRAMQRYTPPLPDAIERYDNRASQVFGFGVGLTFLTLNIGLLVVLMIGLAVLIHQAIGGAFTLNVLMMGLIAGLFGPYLAMYFLDGFTRRRPGRHPRLERALASIYDRFLRLRFTSGTNYPMMLFVSHAGGPLGNYLMAAALTALMLVSIGRMETSRSLWRLDGYGLLPGDGKAGRTLDPRHYADQRERLGSLLPAVHIPSEEVKGDWLRVFIPFRPTPDTLALQRLCPELEGPTAPEPAAVLTCLPKRFALAIDGNAIPAPDFDFASDPAQQLRGVVARIDVRDLPRGRHELSLRYGGMREEDQPKDDPERPQVRIPFWR